MATTVYASEDTYAVSGGEYEHGSLDRLEATAMDAIIDYTYIKFDLSSWAGKTLSEGLLNMYITENHLGSDTTIIFKRIVDMWDESTLMWSNRPNVTDVNNRCISISTSATGWQTYNITGILQDMIDDESCCGVFVMLRWSDLAGSVYFNSLNGDVNKRPYLQLTEGVAPPEFFGIDITTLAIGLVGVAAVVMIAKEANITQ